jgi:heme exporter protein A
LETASGWKRSILMLSVSGLHAVRGGREVLKGLEFQLHAGGVGVVMGPNGCGKSTLLRVLAGLIRPDSGHIDAPFLKADEALREHVHLIGHKDAIKDALSVHENLDFWAQILGGMTADVDAALEQVGLMPLSALPAGILSAGQRRRLALARLLVATRPIWLLDEPATALDCAGIELLDRLVAQHRASGGGIIAATHTPLGWPDGVAIDMRAGA